jgi:prepilin-type processing-associated H-X9-DG protein
MASVAIRLNSGLLIPEPAAVWAPGQGQGWLYNPIYERMGQFGFLSQHPGGANFLFGDGSVRYVKETIDMGNLYTNPPAGTARQGVYRDMATRKGGEVISADQF